MSEERVGCPREVAEHAALTVASVQRALGVTLAFDSETLPVLDHYLRGVPPDQAATVALVASTAGAYFGEVVRHHIGGRWDVAARAPEDWRFVLPSGLGFVPARYALAAVLRTEADDAEAGPDLDAPAIVREMIEEAVAAMADVTEESYYSLCGRLDTLEHLHEVVAAHAAEAVARRAASDDAEPSEPS